MLCKLIKMHSTDLSNFANETFEDILVHICDGISDWEELTQEEFWQLQDWIRTANLEIKKEKSSYVLVEKPNTTLRFCIDEQIERENKRLAAEYKKKEEAYEKKQKAKKLAELKKKEKERKQFEELKKKFGES